ncbi:hypothetical protein C1646_775654 [Rhizophagus diaphanus]|nr:hypothetical protein C1646_775654 [Rhizophagus diaphanus] [Rhizophagus sp. MUCL 43196]
MNNSESDKENEIMVKINITENETLLITQVIGLKTDEKMIRELQNFVTDIVYENYEQRFEREMSEISIRDNNENVEDHNKDDIRNDNDVVMEDNESNNIENIEE